jgi:hypothetical protein
MTGWEVDHEYILLHENRGGDQRLEGKLSNKSKIQKNLKLFSKIFKNDKITFNPSWCYQPGLQGSPAHSIQGGHMEDL